MTPALRVRLFFFSMLMSVGMINAYSGIWFAERGLTEWQIGLVGAAPIAVMLAVTLFIGRLADRAGDWRQVIAVLLVVAGLAPVVLIWTPGFWGILLVWSVLATAQRASLPVADAAGMRLARREGMDFGALRALATIGYLAVILVAGWAMGAEDVALFLPIFIALGLVRAGFAVALPPLRATGDIGRTRAALTLRWQPWFFWPLLGWALMNTAHIILNSFQGLLWAQQGLATGTIGALIALGAVAETALFFGFSRLARRVSPLAMLGVAAAAGVIRWSLMALQPGVTVLVLLQLMHALTYALGFLAVTTFIADAVAEDNAAEAQSFMVMLELAVQVPVLVAFGWLAGQLGAGAYLAATVLALAGGGFVLAARRTARSA